MRIRQNSLAFLRLARCGGLNQHVRGWNRCLAAIFPIADQSGDLLQVDYRGLPYVAAPNNYVDWQVLIIGGYEIRDLAIFEAVSAHLAGAVVLDIGANVGHHSFVFASLGWRVLAFEPNPELWPIIEAKIAAAEFENVQLHTVGIGDRDELLAFDIPDRWNSGTGRFLAQDADRPPIAQRLPVRRGDDYLEAHGVSDVDVIKIDVQGFELHVLRGLSKTLARSRPLVCVEIGDENRESIPTLSALASLLPERYVFRRTLYDNLLLFRRARLETLNPDGFDTFDGNALCVPEEHLGWLERTGPL
jgi:FkbM family methyltransferase